MPCVTASLKAAYTTSRIEVWSVLPISGRWRSIQPPISGRSRWPATNGTSSCSTIEPTCRRLPVSPCTFISRPTNSGDTKIPSRLEAEALHTAAATLPPASEVKAMADCTVAGRMHR